jgi:hypothetical protein
MEVIMTYFVSLDQRENRPRTGDPASASDSYPPAPEPVRAWCPGQIWQLGFEPFPAKLASKYPDLFGRQQLSLLAVVDEFSHRGFACHITNDLNPVMVDSLLNTAYKRWGCPGKVRVIIPLLEVFDRVNANYQVMSDVDLEVDNIARPMPMIELTNFIDWIFDELPKRLKRLKADWWTSSKPLDCVLEGLCLDHGNKYQLVTSNEPLYLKKGATVFTPLEVFSWFPQWEDTVTSEAFTAAPGAAAE